MTQSDKLTIAIQALKKVLWQKDCGCDYYHPDLGWTNDSATERDAMYEAAKTALREIGELEQ